MGWKRRLWLIVAVLAAWLVLAAWQWHEYSHESLLAERLVTRQAEAVMNALVGGIQSHRRLGRFFPEQIEAVLDELARSEDVLAVTVSQEGASLSLSAGNADLLPFSVPVELGSAWTREGFYYARQFVLEPDSARPMGPGRGMGRGRWREAGAADSPLSSGGSFVAMLLLDRSGADAMRGRALRQRTFAAMAGGVLLASLVVAWWATVTMAGARGRAALLEAEARRLRDLGQAAAGLAHETRNPLGLIRGWAQRLAESSSRGPDEQRQIQAVIEECDRVTARVNQFLAFAKPCEPQPTPVQVDRMVEELSLLLAPDLEAKGVRLELDGDSGGSAVSADAELLRQALFNLLQNAIHFAPENTAVEVLVRRRAGRCRIEVADRGPGVPAEQAPRLFTPYFTSRSNGTGLGLAIVERIASAHGWRTGYTARPGGGSIFWLDTDHG